MGQGSTMVIKGGATDVVGSLGLGLRGGGAGATTVVDVVGSTDVDAITADEVERVLAHPQVQVGHITHVHIMLPQGETMV